MRATQRRLPNQQVIANFGGGAAQVRLRSTEPGGSPTVDALHVGA